MELRKTVIIGTKAVTIVVSSTEYAITYWQVVNPKTGKGWQKKRDITVFQGYLANMKALASFNKLQKGA